MALSYDESHIPIHIEQLPDYNTSCYTLDCFRQRIQCMFLVINCRLPGSFYQKLSRDRVSERPAILYDEKFYMINAKRSS